MRGYAFLLVVSLSIIQLGNVGSTSANPQEAQALEQLSEEMSGYITTCRRAVYFCQPTFARKFFDSQKELLFQ